MAIYYLCPDSPHPVGGVKVMYRHVDILRAAGNEAYILHTKPRFRCTWFENATPVAHWASPQPGSLHARLRRRLLPASVGGICVREDSKQRRLTEADVLVLPEAKGPGITSIAPGIPKVVLNQNGFMTFSGHSFNPEYRKTGYGHPEVLGVLVNSVHAERYVRYAFPEIAVERFQLSVDPKIFPFQKDKNLQITFSRIKNVPDAREIINLLKFRGALDGVSVKPFINIPQQEVAQLMGESLFFMSLGNREGFGLPAAEAMAAGCLVVGYDGWGGSEFFKPEFSHPIQDGDILSFADTLERLTEVTKNYRANDFLEKRKAASDFINEYYSPAKEEVSVIEAWQRLLARNGDRHSEPKISIALRREYGDVIDRGISTCCPSAFAGFTGPLGSAV